MHMVCSNIVYIPGTGQFGNYADLRLFSMAKNTSIKAETLFNNVYLGSSLGGWFSTATTFQRGV
jgi:hypothetical protein